MAYFKNHKYVKTFKINLGDSFGEDTFIELREPSTEEAFKLRTDGEDDAVKVFKTIMVDLIVNHEFYEDETKSAKLSNKEVTDLIYESFPSFQKVLKDYSDQVFRAE